MVYDTVKIYWSYFAPHRDLVLSQDTLAKSHEQEMYWPKGLPQLQCYHLKSVKSYS